MKKNEQKGLTLIEVALYLSIFSFVFVLAVQACNKIIAYQKEMQLADQIKLFSHGLEKYISDNQQQLWKSKELEQHPQKITLTNLVPAYIADNFSSNFNNSFKRSIEGVIFKEQVGEKQRLVGLVVTYSTMTPKAIDPATAGEILLALGAQGGMENSKNKNKIDGVKQLWQLDKSHYPEIFLSAKFPELKNKEQRFYYLINNDELYQQLANLSIPVLTAESIKLTAFSANKEEQDSNKWQPLYKTDGLTVSWANLQQNPYMVKVELLDGRESVMQVIQTHYTQQTSLTIMPQTAWFTTTDSQYYIRLTPIDSQGNTGQAILSPPIQFRRYSGTPWQSFSLTLGINLYNKDYSIPDKPIAHTRSILGHCPTKQEESKYKQSVGFDIVGMHFVPLNVDKLTGLEYLFPLTVQLHRIWQDPFLSLTLPYAQQIDENWSTYDQRYQYPPLLSLIKAQGDFFYPVKVNCKQEDEEELKIDIEGNSGLITEKSFKWNGKDFSQQEYIDVPLS